MRKKKEEFDLNFSFQLSKGMSEGTISLSEWPHREGNGYASFEFKKNLGVIKL